MFDFPKAIPVPRGCGDREPGGVYLECGLSDHGLPLEAFLVDPPLPVPDGLDLINKPQLWQRTTSSGEPTLDEWEQPMYDVLVWIGAEYYPYCPDFIEEVRRFGASRRLNPNLDLSLLSRSSRMILAHPFALNTEWQSQRPPRSCDKNIAGHAGNTGQDEVNESEEECDEDEDEEEQDEDALSRMCDAASARSMITAQAHAPHLPAAVYTTTLRGPCLFKTWELIPQEAAQTVIALDEQQADAGAPSLPLCLRAVGSTIYQYHPTGESSTGLIPGIFAVLPITGFALIRFADGSVNEKARAKVMAGIESHGSQALPFYETDR